MSETPGPDSEDLRAPGTIATQTRWDTPLRRGFDGLRQVVMRLGTHGLVAGFYKLTNGGNRASWAAAFIAILVAIPCALLMPPLDRDESRFAQATAQMIESHDYIDIRYQEQPRHKKPVGIHWLQAAAVTMTSDVAQRHIFPFRWPSILGAALAAFSVAWGAKRLFGVRTAQIAGVLFGLSFLLSSEAFIAKTDAVLCGLTTLMMAALARIYFAARAPLTNETGDPPDDIKAGLFKEKVIFWLALSGTILIKGPIGPMILAAAMLSLAAWDKTSRQPVGWMRHLGWGWGLLSVLALCGPWAIAITIKTDGAFWGQAVGGDLAPKLAGGQEGHSAPPGLHTLLLPLLTFPACFLLAGAFEVALKRSIEPAVRFAICWFLPGFLIFELSPTKLIHYPLPTYGGLFWLMAVSLETPLRSWARWTNLGLGIFGGLMIALIGGYGYWEYDRGLGLVPAVILMLGAVIASGVGGYYLWRNKQQTGLGILILAGLVCHLCFVITLSQLKDFWLSQKMERALIAAKIDPRAGIIPGPVASFGYAEPSLVFELGTSTELVPTAEAAIKALGNERPVFVDANHSEAFLAAARAAGMNPRARAVIEGYNYSEGDPQTITLYQIPAADRLNDPTILPPVPGAAPLKTTLR